MSQYVDDNLTLPHAKTDDPDNPPTGATDECAAADWNTAMSAVNDALDRAFKKDSADASILTPRDGSFKKLMVITNDTNSRDAPAAGFIFRNEGLDNNPTFLLGNPYIAGIGLAAGGIWYTDDTLEGAWKILVSFEQSGTFATVLDGVLRSAFESFHQNGDFKPWMRLEAYSQALNIGPGGCIAVAGDAVRSSGVLTIHTVNPHRFGVGQKLWKTPAPGGTGQTADFGSNDDLWGPGGTARYVATIVDANTFTVADSRSNVTSTEDLSFSGETDVAFGRDGYKTAAIRADGTTVVQIAPNTFHVLDSADFWCEGRFRGTGWYNAGGQTQGVQRDFLVGGTGARTTTLPPISVSWQECYVKNVGTGNLTVSANGTPDGARPSTNTINGGATYVLAAGAGMRVVSNDVNNDWSIYYSPPPP